ncbi:unnamed protein product [Urochloa humidicola]
MSTPSATLRGFLDTHFASPEDLAAAPALAELLRRECAELHASLRRLDAQLAAAAASWLARSAGARSDLRRIRSPGLGGAADAEHEGAEMVGLPALVREIQRIDTIRLYAEATLQLEALVGNLEDVTFSIVRHASKLSLPSILWKSNETDLKQAKLLNAVNAVRDIERELVRIGTSRPQWTSLIMAVDTRVDKTLAILRPQALTDYRALLAALGWPPSLSSPETQNDKYSQIPNPLVLMNEGNKEKYSQSFMALCALQHVQANREVRQCQIAAAPTLAESKYSDKTACLDNGLWAIDELVHPVASRMEYHFAKWSEQPEFIFTLVYKITKDFMDGVDDILQPLIDHARLAGLSAKESWVTGMVKMLVGYLERQIFPALVTSIQDQATAGKPEVESSWLHLNDLMISFDKRMQLLADSGIQKILSLSEGLPRSLSIFSIYSEHPDWLQIWASLELSSAQDKLKSEMEDEISWSFSDSQHDQHGHMENSIKFLLTTREDYKAPPVSEFVVRTALSMIERGRALRNRGMQIQYNRSSSVKFLNDFFLVLRDRCEALQLSNTALEDQSLSKASCAINAARYCENVLREWDEDTTFLDICTQGSLFTDEITFLVKLGTNYLEQILSAILLEFEDLSWEYVQNIGSWSGQTVLDDQVLDEENAGVSSGFVASLDVLTDRVSKLKLYLNSKDFLDLWRSIAEGLDYFIYSSIRWGEVNFSDTGIIQLRVDTKALLHIFRPFCSRPEAFLPFLSESLRLLTMKKSDAQYLLEMLTDDTSSDNCLKHQELHHVNGRQATKILRSRKFGG